MADPLSIQNAISGLVTAVAQISKGFKKIMVDAPEVASSAVMELDTFSNVINAVQELVANLETVATDRKSLIELDHFITIITDAVLTFSELRNMVDKFPTRSRLRLARDRSSILRLVGRVRQHQSLMSMMLNIIQWYTIFHSFGSHSD